MRPSLPLCTLVLAWSLGPAGKCVAQTAPAAPPGLTDNQPAGVVPARIDERVELLSIVARLAEFYEFRQPSASSPYSADVDRQFGPFKDHEAVRLAKQLRQDRGLGFDGVPRFALYLKGNPRLEPIVAFDNPRFELDKRWTPEAAAAFLAALQRFADDSHAFEFFAAHRDLYTNAARNLAAEVAKRPYRAWLDGFFGAKPGAEFCAIVGMLDGGANFGIQTRFPDLPEQIMPVIGVQHFDGGGVPIFGAPDSVYIAHEFCHSYCNPLVDRHFDRLGPAAERIFPHRRVLMEQQAYGAPRLLLHEAMVRACTNRFLRAHGTREEADRQMSEEVFRGFIWTPDLTELLAEYERSRDKYPTFDSFAPRIIAFFEGVAASMPERMAKFPRVANLSPANGAQGVDPGTSELRIEFDRPMRDGSSAVLSEKDKGPETPESGRYLSDHRTFVQPIRLQPGKDYVLRLNTWRQQGFISAEGLPLDEMEVTFTTAKP